MNNPRFNKFIEGMTALLDKTSDEEIVLAEGRTLLQELVAHDDWLDDAYAQPHPEYYQQYRLHVCPQGRFSVVSFVWGPGQKTPVHDHTVWGLIGMLRGSETALRFSVPEAGKTMEVLGEDRLEPGDVDAVSPTIGDVHQVANAYDDQVSISIHVYGADIGKVERHVFNTENGAAKAFISGYANA